MVGIVTHSIIHYYNLYIRVLKTIMVFSLKHIGNFGFHILLHSFFLPLNLYRLFSFIWAVFQRLSIPKPWNGFAQLCQLILDLHWGYFNMNGKKAMFRFWNFKPRCLHIISQHAWPPGKCNATITYMFL